MYRVDVYLRVRRAVMVEGMSLREAARVFGLHRDTVRKMLAYSVPPAYRRQNPPRKLKLSPYTGVIDRVLEDDLRRPRKQRHTAKLDFTHFKRHKRGNLQYDGTEWRGVSVHRSWRSIVKNPPTPTTSGYAQR